MIAAERVLSPLKVVRFQNVVVEAHMSRPARHADLATDAVSVAIAEKRKVLVPECELALRQRDRTLCVDST
jgi:hypothetical protein